MSYYDLLVRKHMNDCRGLFLGNSSEDAGLPTLECQAWDDSLGTVPRMVIGTKSH